MGFKGKSISIASYDAGNRLTAWNRAGADENHSQTWDYDNAGNWNSTTKDGDTEGRDHSVSNQITQLDGKAVSHDLKGNLTDYEYDRTDYRVKYDLDNRIVEVKADSETIRYRYDALGRRIISKGDDETVLIWWGDSECAEYEHRASQDAIQNDIMGHPARLNSVIARDTEDRENRVELQWYHKNYLDHVYAVSDDNGNLVEHYRYTAFGEPEIYSATGAKRNTSAIENTVMWNTRRYDAGNGLYYYKYRHYAANIGRWPGRDPIEEEGGINLYAFVGNDSINSWDLFGWDWVTGNGSYIDNYGQIYDANGNYKGRLGHDASMWGLGGIDGIAGPPPFNSGDIPEDGGFDQYEAEATLEPEPCCKGRKGVAWTIDYFSRKCCEDEIETVSIQMLDTEYGLTGLSNFGHAAIQTPNQTAGLWPKGGASKKDRNTEGLIADDSSYPFTHSRNYRACPSSVKNIDSWINNQRNRINNLNTNPFGGAADETYQAANGSDGRNCYGWACQAISDAGGTPPDSPTSWLLPVPEAE